MINIHVGSTNRSGGSLFCRLLDGHPDVASYPIEVSFPGDFSISPFIERITGHPHYIPTSTDFSDVDLYNLLHLPKEKIMPKHQWGKEQSDPMGVRKNYLEKEFYGKVKTDFDFEEFQKRFDELTQNCQSFREIWNARHTAYFKAWENNKYSGTMQYVVTHCSGGLYLSNLSDYFKVFPESYFVYPIRDLFGYVASEKTRLARRYYGSRRFPKIKMPNGFVKMFQTYDLDSHIDAWLSAVSRVILFQEKYGVEGEFIVYRYENLLDHTESVIRYICEKTGLRYDPILLQPTIAGQSWGGSSHQGKQKGINKKLKGYYREVLTAGEIKRIESRCNTVLNYLKNIADTPADLTNMPKTQLVDYEYQKKYFNDNEKSAMLGAIANCRRRRYKIGVPNRESLLALVYSKIVRIVHIPRLVKLRYLPGWGKQNYT